MRLGEFIAEAPGVVSTEYGSVNEAIAEALATGQANFEPNAVRIDRQLAGMAQQREFYNGYTLDSLRAAIAAPPQALVRTVERVKEQLERQIELPIGRRRRVHRRLDCGDELDPQAWLMRDPQGWSQVRYEQAPRHLFRIAVNVSEPCHATAERLVYRGAGAVALADLLTSQGYSVDLVCYECCESLALCYLTYVTRIEVKRPDMPLDLPAAALALAEIAFFRAIVMSAQARRVDSQLDGGWGRTRRLPACVADTFDVVLDSDVHTEQAVVALLNRFATQGATEIQS